jgi:hypothetical protein
MLTESNHIKLFTDLNGQLVSNFSLNEFESKTTGLVIVHPTLLVSLEQLRAHLNRELGNDVIIKITCGTRLPSENEALAARLGYTDQGGAVSRTSKHLPEYGGIAVDFYAIHRTTGKIIPSAVLGPIAAKYFDWVKYNYPDDHVHADNRVRAK